MSEMPRDWESLLDESLSASPESQQAEPKLRPLLRAARTLKALAPTEPMRADAVAAGRRRFLAQAEKLQAEPNRRFLWQPWLGRLAVTAATVVLLTAILGGGAAWASADSLPGDSLYQIKLLVQELRLFFTFDPRAKVDLRVEFNNQRVEEVRLVVEARRQTEVDFRGVVEGIEGDVWVIAGIPVLVNAQTEFEGPPQVGDFVHVHALAQADGSLVAREIEVEEAFEVEARLTEAVAELRGPLGGLSTASATVCSVGFVVAANTEIEGRPQAGDPVKMEFAVEPDGDFLAVKIEVEEEPEECELRVEGRVQVVSDTVGSVPWVVEGIQVLVNAATEVRGAPQVGDFVKVRAAVDANARFFATRLEVEREGEEAAGSPTATEVRFEGTLQSFTAEVWVVSGRSVRIAASTEIRGAPVVGATVEVRALQQADSTLVATHLEVEQFEAQEVRWEGRIESMEGSRWIVAGRAVQVTNSTEILGTPTVGAEAEVRALLQPDGTLLATRIEIEDDSGSGSGSGGG